MIGVYLLSEEVVKWCRFQNEMIGIHLLSVRTSSIGTHDWCTFTVQSKQVVYCH